MKNKLPEVGKRYRRKHYGDNALVINLTQGRIVYEIISGYSKGEVNSYERNSAIWNYFEELPNQDNGNKSVETEQKPDSLPIQESNGTNAEVDKAKKELKSQLFFLRSHYSTNSFAPVDSSILERRLEALSKVAQNLLNAMDETRPQKGDFSENCTGSKSVWKDVSELPKETVSVIIQLQDGKVIFGCYHYYDQCFKQISFNEDIPTSCGNSVINKYCTLTDYINEQEQFKKDVLERLNKLEGK